MHPADIKASLSKAGSSQSLIARQLRGRKGEPITPGAVWLVIEGRARSERIAAHISKTLGMPVRELFPGKYPRLEKHQAIQARGGRSAVLQSSLQSPTPSEKKRA